VSWIWDTTIFVATVTRGVAKGAITCEDLGNFTIPCPPLPEQHTIVADVNNRIAGFDALIADAERAVGLLLERRTALVSAAVTGQIDVRESANQRDEAAKSNLAAV
jgi:type I restriction enzyme, S subunit